METNQYYELYKLENAYWWFIGKRLIITSLLEDYIIKKPIRHMILDAGCGTGKNLSYFRKYGYAIGLDKSQDSLKYCIKREIKNLVQGELRNIPFKRDIFQIILALDVLEHLSDREEINALEELYRTSATGGYLVITVPALPILWSAHDKALGHYRRYTLNQLRKNVISVGFNIEKISYYSFFVFPIILISRYIKRIHFRQPKTDFPYVPPLLNKILIYIMKLESISLKKINFPIGSSIICLVRKRNKY